MFENPKDYFILMFNSQVASRKKVLWKTDGCKELLHQDRKKVRHPH